MKLACLTGGGDAPGLNAVLRGLVLQAGLKGASVTAYLRGWKGLVDGQSRPLTPEDVADIHRQGGTVILSSRTNPAKIENGYEIVKKRLKADGIDCLVAIGGEDTLGVANKLHGEHGQKVIGVPKTIDNDLSATDYTFGFDTAINIAMDCLDKLHTTAYSHERVLVVEIMGRHAGWMALEAGVAGGAHVILVPEKKFSVKEICEVVEKRYNSGKRYALIAVAEGALPENPAELGETGQGGELDSFGHVKLGGGIAERLAKAVEKGTKRETRHVVLGHIQRGGPPSAFDRVLGTRLGQEAAKLALGGQSGLMVGLRGTEIQAVPLKEAVSKLKTVPLARYEDARAFFG